MNLVLKYMGVAVEGITAKQLRSILSGNDTITVVKTPPGMLFLSDKTVIKCVSNYYSNPRQDKKPKKMANQCYSDQKYLNIMGVPSFSCLHCHLECIRMTEANELTFR